MPSEIASLICSKTSVNLLGNEEDLAKFMINQKIETFDSNTED